MTNNQINRQCLLDKKVEDKLNGMKKEVLHFK